MTTLQAPIDLAPHLTSPTLVAIFERSRNWRSMTVDIPLSRLSDADLTDLTRAAEASDETALRDTVSAVISARSGAADSVVTTFASAPFTILAYLRESMIDGWVYTRGLHGHLVPSLVTDVRIFTPSYKGASPVLEFVLAQSTPLNRQEQSWTLQVQRADVTKRKVTTILEKAGIFKETPALKAGYERTLAHFQEHVIGGFAQQYRFTGALAERSHSGTPDTAEGRKVIHDVHPNDVRAPQEDAPSVLHAPSITSEREAWGLAPLPVNPVVTVFDLSLHLPYVVHADDLTPYEWDDSLREKIILPASQRELLDILTQDLGTFSSDLIEGKAAGSTIICKGPPGVGKTLTAEVFSEITHRPLYAIHSGTLGASAESVKKALVEVFKRAKRWNAVLLLDEADVFVLERGDDLSRNAVVAEFLRTLEYFDGLLFMTTNRADAIDDAILSRAVAVIDYHAPEGTDLAKAWRVLANAVGVELPDDVLAQALEGFGPIPPRDIKMLLALAARVAQAKGESMTADLLRRCAIFRGLTWVGEAPAEAQPRVSSVRSSRVPGHALTGGGAPVYTSESGAFLGYEAHTSEGPGMCECGALSPDLPSVRQRQEWHRQHKRDLRAAGEGR